MQETETEPKADEITFCHLNGTLAVPFRVEVRRGEFLTGTVRPPTQKELRVFLKKAADAKDDADKVQAEFFAAHIKTWNYDADPTAAVIVGLPGPLFTALDRVVCDLEGCDLILGKSAGSSRS